MRELTVAERCAIPRHSMPHQDPRERVGNFDEVALGWDAETAVKEAQRCLLCRKPQCVASCPAEIDIPGFIAETARGNFREASTILRESSALPAVCGRVCPQETQCEQLCVLGKKHEPVAIGRLERFVSDYALRSDVPLPALPPSTGKKVAVVGAGPAGITVAGDLVKLGHEVTLFEALHMPGGVLVYGIPEFRLPKEIVRQEVDLIRSLGVRLVTNFVVGRTATVDELLEEHDAVFLGNGAGAPSFLGIPGENLNGVYSASEYLTRCNLMRANDFPRNATPVAGGRKVVVLGGGNVAMDAVRVALRLGADEASILYRRSRNELPARLEEIENAEEEGVKFSFLANPVRIVGGEHNCVTGVECVRMELGEPDSSGRRRPIPVAGSEFVIEADTVVVAIGQNANPIVASTATGVETDRRGYFKADAEGRTTKPGVFAGGDIVTGAATVILAIGAGKKAARAMHEYLLDSRWPDFAEA
ncbi:NADPH-dependent glutamate synthase [Geomonas sp. RF6]|uniref:NADPH-dependent glutamate synthase n=1 Tax=Geomonas sp. RF6 TaxID=2897342 RepID=UPI001E2C974B|nr:NADPH-dependent glutamate synthase [Geomonas sp. RF6]UFS69288.1 NADPH-dependent glutamate synthase [Geomonas sp. RF6]